MNKLKYIYGIVFSVLFFSCTDFVNEVADDPNSPQVVSENLLLPSAQLSSSYAIGGEISRNTSIWMQQVTGVSRQPVSFSRYQAQPTSFTAWEENLYPTALADLNKVREYADANGNNHYSAIADIYTAYLMLTITDLWNEAPYSEALIGNENTTPKYDSQQDIYKSVNDLLDSGISKVSKSAGAKAPGSDDLFFEGDMSKWVKFAYAIKARAALHLSKTSLYKPTDVLDAVSKSFSSNLDDAVLRFGIPANEQNPLYTFDVSRASDVKMSSFSIDNMKRKSDPRLSLFAQKDANGNYTGAAPGIENPDVSAIGTFYNSKDAPVVLLSYAELKFMEAEVRFGQGNKSGAATALKAAVKASMDWFGVNGTSYIASYADFTSNSSALTLEDIMNEKYYALYLQPESFADWRRTGFPAISPAADNSTSNNIPRRFLYPESERDYNSANMPVVKITDRVWWDVN